MSEKFGRNRAVRLWTTSATESLPKALKTFKKSLEKYFSLIFQMHLILSWKDYLALVTFSNLIFYDFIILTQNTLYPDNPMSSICQASSASSFSNGAGQTPKSSLRQQPCTGSQGRVTGTKKKITVSLSTTSNNETCGGCIMTKMLITP